MEVLRENFNSLFPEIKEAIEKCSFMAIDTELTGLRVSDAKDNYFDTMEERYKSIRESSRQYLIIQFGLVTFFYDEAEDRFTHKAYNFYTYPSQTKNFMPTIRFLCESSSIEFLSSFGFDFNKLFHHGVPYMSTKMTQKVIADQEEKEAKWENEKQPASSVPENFKKFVDDAKGIIIRFLASSKKEFLFENLSPFQRKLIFENFKPHYPNLLFETVHTEDEESESLSSSEPELDVSDPDENGKGKKNSSDASGLPKSMADLSLPTAVKQKQFKKPLKIIKVSDEDIQKRKEEKRQKFEKGIESMVAFSKVIQEISKSSKIVVGHNMLLDVSHAVNQFVDDLPDTLSDFKNLVQTAFPNLIDTKLMASQLPFREFFKSSVLQDVMTRLESDPFSFEDCKIQPGEFSKGYDFSQGKFHEAGYDAYVTGLCFISMCKYLGTLQNPKKPRVLPDSPIVLPFINKLYLMRMMDVCYMNISGSDLTPSRSHVFFIKCPKNTSIDYIRAWFSPFGQIQYHWQGDDIFVSLIDKDQAPLVLRNIEEKDGFNIIPFDTYTQLKDNRQTPSSGNNDVDGNPSPTPVQTKRQKTENEIKRKPAVKPPSLFETPAKWD